MQRLAFLPTVESIAPTVSQPPLYTAPDQKLQPGLVLSDLPRPAIQALQKVLPHWKKVGASYRKMQRAGPLPAEALEALLKLADSSKRSGTAEAAGGSNHCAVLLVSYSCPTKLIQTSCTVHL